MNYNNLISAASFSPNHLEFPNSWFGHLPFAAWLTKQFAPNIFVELGTHSGNSYFTFCQAVSEATLSTKCYAVDTWKGDEHAGYYSEEIFHHVNGYNQAHYAGFSRLLRMTFDEATDYFSDKSIELLHIDGLHTYDAVKHDFETWLPKLAPGAIVIFHDTNVREMGFGVWKLWEELQGKYTLNLEFVHSHGLGVLQLSNGASEKVLPWLLNKQEQQLIKDYFSEIGTRQLQRYEIAEFHKTVAELRRNIDELHKSVVERDGQINYLNQSVSDHTTRFNEILAQRDEYIDELKRSLKFRENQVDELERTLAERNKQLIELDEETVRRGKWALGLEAELFAEREKSAALQRNLDEAVNSNSWKLTLPLREVKLWVSRPKGQTKRYAGKSLRILKRLYQSMPFDVETVEKHRNLFAKHSPKLLTVTGSRLDGKEGVVLPEELVEIQQVYSLPEAQVFFANPTAYLDNAKAIKIHSSENPLVSVIIPIYGKLEYTLNCLASIAANLPAASFEVIIIDDCSPDDSADILTHVKGIRLLQNEKNQGFIRSCNLGGTVAKGKYLYFLNNDTQVMPGWMDELVRTFHEFPGTGLAGSKLIYPDGRLQEAGGIIWQDGSAWNFGHGQDPRLPIYNYAREVDYCSGASIMVPKTLYDELGGFDTHYLPAYCEDSDLALKIRDKGYRVIYQPLSTVVHYEGVTSGTDVNSGAKAYQIENTKKLYARWKDRLQKHQALGADVDNAKDRKAKYRILVLENCIPTPNQDAGSVTVFNLLLLLREMDFQVTFIPEDNFLYVPEYTAALQRIGVEVLYTPYVTSLDQHLREYGERYDIAFLFRPDLVERSLETVRRYCSNAKVLYYTHDLHFLRMMREAELFQDEEKFKLADEMKEREFRVINNSDASILVTEKELAVIENEFPGDKLHVLPLILNTPGTKKVFSDRQDIIFVGGFQHPPNTDAVQFFVSEIMPLIRHELPEVSFNIVGSKPPQEIKELASDDVIVAGFVEDLVPLLDRMRVSVAPLRYGAGIKGKIGTAMGVGLPVVATTVAVEGMSLTDGENVLVADTPEDFAKAIIRLYQDEKLWNKLSQKGLGFATNVWGAESAWKILSEIIRSLGINPVRGKHPLSLYSEYNSSEIETEPTTVAGEIKYSLSNP